MSKLQSHLGGHGFKTNTDKPVFDHIVDKFNIKSVVDIGCGVGGMQELADKKNVKWYGIDGDDAVIKTTENTLLHDFTLGSPNISIDFDLAWSVEFLEHVYEEYMPNYMQVFERAKYVCCTAARPGKKGHHHVNCQDTEYWIDAFKQYGFTFDQEYTNHLYSISKMRKKFFRRSGMFYYK
jgi:hypothetical protein